MIPLVSRSGESLRRERGGTSVSVFLWDGGVRVSLLLKNEQDALARFRRSLSKIPEVTQDGVGRAEDQLALDSLFRSARYHVAALSLASHLLPFEVMLLGMLIEEHKRIDKLERLLGKAAGQTQDEMDLYDAA